jgi:hypothetical protein
MPPNFSNAMESLEAYAAGDCVMHNIPINNDTLLEAMTVIEGEYLLQELEKSVNALLNSLRSRCQSK